MKNTAIIVLAALGVYVLLIILGQAKNPFAATTPSTGGRQSNGDIKCELRGSDGRPITIIGRGEEFERLCRQRDPLSLYGYQYYPLYYYTWYWPWGWRRWPSGGPGSMTGGGTGGGGQTGTGAGTGTPGTGTP